jgi:hypothetical protein
MFWKNELERLRLQKELLVLESDANRLVLVAEWQRLRSPETWMNEAGNLVRRHPIWTTALATAVGTLVVQAVRKPGAVAGGIGRLGKIASLFFSVSKLFKAKNSES